MVKEAYRQLAQLCWLARVMTVVCALAEGVIVNCYSWSAVSLDSCKMQGSS